MPYGFTRKYNRLSDEKYRYRKISKKSEYVYVDHGFYHDLNWNLFDIRNPLNVPVFVTIHVLYVFYLYKYVTDSKYWPLMIMNAVYFYWCTLGLTAGVHRLWAHRTYSAHWTLRLFLAVGYSSSVQSSILDWSRGHRVHHKWSDTDSDPHNANRSFGFSHIWWVLQREHPDVARAERLIRTDDLESDPIVHFQHKYYVYIFYVCSGVVPFVIHYYWLGGHWLEAIPGCMIRNVVNLHCAAFVNSAAHMFGNRPYNSKIMSSENMSVSIATLGEGNTDLYSVCQR